MTDAKPLISVCISTYRRPETLQTLLQALQNQTLRDFEIIVVDNDAAASAKTVVTAFRQQSPHALHYQLETQQNIAIARNATVKLANGAWIAFIDDDEFPEKDWLQAHFQAAKTFNADGVFGPVLPLLDTNTPQWIQQGHFHHRQRFTDGTVMPEDQTRTSNAFIRAELLKNQNEPFDPQFGRTGGEDTVLFTTLKRAGANFVWCDTAMVSEHVPANRLSSQWLIQRAFRQGQTSAQVAMRFDCPKNALPALLFKAIFSLRALSLSFIALGLLATDGLRGKHRRVYWQRKWVAQWGKLSAIAGYRYIEYHG